MAALPPARHCPGHMDLAALSLHPWRVKPHPSPAMDRASHPPFRSLRRHLLGHLAWSRSTRACTPHPQGLGVAMRGTIPITRQAPRYLRRSFRRVPVRGRIPSQPRGPCSALGHRAQVPSFRSAQGPNGPRFPAFHSGDHFPISRYPAPDHHQPHHHATAAPRTLRHRRPRAA